MDFIQSAIEKARQERLLRSAGAAPALVQAPPSSIPSALSDATADLLRADLWAGLQEIRPREAHLERHHLHARTRSGEGAAFDMMRTKLLHELRSHNWRRVAITSPTPACGKTTLALNLAYSIARQRDLSCMLLEFDMRRPSIAGMLGVGDPPQFADVLSGDTEPEAALCRIGGNFAVGMNASARPDSAELLQRVETGRIVDRIEQRFAPDVMLFDMPPMLQADDTLGFIDQIDCVLLVAAAGSSSMAEIARCSDELKARCNFLGVVLNKCRYLDRSDAYGYGHGYGGYGPEGGRSF
ncbi:MAG: CpsD/CapB family tyrosine-protein kinase [Alkalilacustris sp.]